ncbi:MAG: hypothetical protein SFT92_02240 [Rickettsiales bacterium]|nr:hypothetical protein [Rickettsiales bacterium]
MTAPHYYGSTSGILVDRFLKYGLFPFALGSGYLMFHDHDKATRFAQTACLLGASAITTTFLGLESDMLDKTGREAVSAAMGVDPSQIEFSDFKYCDNIIVKKAYEDLMHLQKYRYGTDLLFVLPNLVEASYGKMTGKELPASKDVMKAFESRDPSNFNPGKYSPLEVMLQGHNGWAMGAYAGKALYWSYETYGVPKTAYYETVKMREKIESTGSDLRANDLKAIYQRARNDRGLPMVSLNSKEENDALRQLLDRMTEAYNQHDGKFGLNEIVHLIGSGAINIHEKDGVTFSLDAVTESNKAIDKVLAIGLSGIREENRKVHERKQALGIERGSLLEGGIVHDNVEIRKHKTFADRLSDKAVGAIRSVLNRTNMTAGKPEEFVSVRDPTDIVGNSGMSR